MGALHVNGEKVSGVDINIAEGVFIDTDNVIYAEEINTDTIVHTSYSYTALEDCYIYAGGMPGGGTNDTCDHKIDEAVVNKFGHIDYKSFGGSYLVKKGQIFSMTNIGYWYYIKVYGIQQGTIEGKLQPVIYSTEEREVGVWTDGKPLYEKTIINDNPTYIQQVGVYEVITSVDMSDMDMVFLDNTIAHNQDGSRFINDTRTDLTAFGYVSIRKNNNDIYLAINTNAYTEFYYIIRYTKTTDQAGAGTWTPDGAYAHHYSTDEKVVGTWVDGSTIYEKTIEINSIAYDNNWHNVAHGITNIDKVISCAGILFGADGEFFNLPQYRADTSQGITFGIQGNSSEYIAYINNWYEGANKIYATIQYTKASS